jgi:hypothetical protein
MERISLWTNLSKVVWVAHVISWFLFFFWIQLIQQSGVPEVKPRKEDDDDDAHAATDDKSSEDE